MPSAKELRDELRALRKEHVKPVSRMRVGDMSAEIERLRRGREETPAAAAVPSAPSRVSKAAVESIKKAKESEFPVKPGKKVAEHMKPAAAPKKSAAEPKKSRPSKADLLKMIGELTSDEE